MKKVIDLIKTHNIARAISLVLPIFLLIFLVNVDLAHAGWVSDLGDAVVGALKSAAKTIFGLLFQTIGWLMGLFSGLLLIMAGQFLDMTIVFGLDSRNITEIPGILIGWGILRDLVNMMFIFILLYIGIATIIRTTSFSAKKILINLVLVALFVNFSYFLTGFVIDVGNVMAGSIYSAITPVGVDAMGNDFTAGIGGQFIDNMDMSLVRDQLGLTGSITGDGAFKLGIMYIMTAIFEFIASFVLFTAAFLFITRHIMLVFLIVLSPVAFAAYILPSTQKHWSNWFGKLIGATFVAPIFLLLISIVLAISNVTTMFTPPASFVFESGQEFDSPLLSTPGLIMNYILIIGLLIGSYTVAKQVGGSIVSMSGKWAGKITGAGVGTMAFAGRRTLGRASRALSENEALKNRAAQGGMLGYGARAAMRVGDAGSKAGFDVRGGVLGSTLRSTTGVDLGKASGKGGYDKTRKDQIKRREDLSKKLSEGNITRAEYKQINAAVKGDETKINNELKKVRTNLKGATGRNRELLFQQESALRERLATAEKARTGTQGREIREKLVAQAQEAADTRAQGPKDGDGKRRGGRKTEYIKTLETPTFATRLGMQTAANREVAKKIRKGKPTMQQIKDVLDKGGELDSYKTETTQAPPEPEAPKGEATA